MLACGRRQRGVADVVAGVEVRVVDPHRAGLRERRERELLAVARDQVQPVLDLRDEVVVRRRLAVEDEHRSPRACGRRPSRVRGTTRRGR